MRCDMLLCSYVYINLKSKVSVPPLKFDSLIASLKLLQIALNLEIADCLIYNTKIKGPKMWKNVESFNFIRS